MTSHRGQSEPLCPSARPEAPDARIFGVVDNSGEAPEVRYLAEPVPVTAEVRALLQGAPPGEVWRVGARCAGSACGHFDGAHCSLGERLVQLHSRPKGPQPPSCALRAAGCRWFRERGIDICFTCRFVVSEGETLLGSEADRAALGQPSAAGREPIAQTGHGLSG
ncbi:MAG: nitrogen fixation protein [Thermoanaerobaculia bacterium]|nr:nitrogen fixation protein [Thermoanaerobaculia bacterium]MBP9824878.1 nitrogen fixation protein [Thermoanaerobaculia bacterium]